MSRYDEITEADLRAAGSMKWTAYPGKTGAWVAEMDFGVAPAIQDALSSAAARGLTGYLPPWLTADLARATADCTRAASDGRSRWGGSTPCRM